MSQKLPGVQVFPAMGNHERAPANLYEQAKILRILYKICGSSQLNGFFLIRFPTIEQDSTMSMFYNDIDTLWRRWLPSNVSSTVKHAAYYSALVRPSFRIISLNMNACSNLNFWLLRNSTDPYGQLQWLIVELQAAEMAHEKVHIIGHIPPGSTDCLKTWSRNYYEIIARYEDTVAAQFFGHTHFDEFEVFYDPKNMSYLINIFLF